MSTIRTLRQARGLTQFDLAIQVGVQPLTVSLWERGERTPHVSPLRMLGRVFEMCSDDIQLELRDKPALLPYRPRMKREPGRAAPNREQHEPGSDSDARPISPKSGDA